MRHFIAASYVLLTCRVLAAPGQARAADPIDWSRVRALHQRAQRGEKLSAEDLNCDPAKGPVKAPLLLWGPYLWTAGDQPRGGDGLVWTRADVANDGVHPSASGQLKVGDLLLGFFKTDPLARQWFVANP